MDPFHSALTALLLAAAAAGSFAQGTAFTYQGSLNTSGTAANGLYEATFTLYDAVTNGNVIGLGQTVAPLVVSNGLFTATLDFGAAAFNGSPRWLEISVNVFGSDMIPTTLTPRQKILPTPYAIHAANAAGLMTFDNSPLDIKVNGQRALRLESTTETANIIGGFEGNSAGPGTYGVFIGGGGFNDGTEGVYPNRVTANFGTIVGGFGNRVDDESGFVGGGENNRLAAGAYSSTIVGGRLNQIDPESREAFIGGGFGNWLQRESPFAVVTGGFENSVRSNAMAATIGGGERNVVLANANHATIAGGIRNTNSREYATIGGGQNNSVQAGDATIAGGANNHVAPEADRSVVGGGVGNSIGTNSTESVIAGGAANRIFSNVGRSAILGGFDNSIGSGTSTIGGGRENGIAEGSHLSAIGGGSGNGIGTNSGGSVIGGGIANQIPPNSESATIPGGSGNTATKWSFAAGVGAAAIHPGAFVWSDPSGPGFSSAETNEFAARARGGVRFVTAMNGDGTPAAGVTLAPGSGSWSSLSDRNAKEHFAPANGLEILAKLASLPLMTWNYKTQDKAVRHIGPMAQDFRAAFGLGENDRTITTLDADGVALAAIQGLNQKVEEENRALRTALDAKNEEIAELRRGLAELRQLIERR